MVWSNQAPTSLTFPPGATTGARITIDQNGIRVFDATGALILEILPNVPAGGQALLFPSPAATTDSGISFFIAHAIGVFPFPDHDYYINLIKDAIGLNLEFELAVINSSTGVESDTSLVKIGLEGFQVGSGEPGLYYYEEASVNAAAPSSAAFTNLSLTPGALLSDYGSCIGAGHFVAPEVGIYDFQLQVFGSAAMANGRFQIIISEGPLGTGIQYAYDDIQYTAAPQAPRISIPATALISVADTVYFAVQQSSGVAQAFTGRLTLSRKL